MDEDHAVVKVIDAMEAAGQAHTDELGRAIGVSPGEMALMIDVALRRGLVRHYAGGFVLTDDGERARAHLLTRHPAGA